MHMVNRTATSTLERIDVDIQDEMLAKAFWALGHPIRMRIVRILIDEGEQTVGGLTERLPVSQPQVSVHLKCLTECGFTSVRRQGRHSYHRIASPWTAGLLSLIRDHADTYAAGLLECIECSPSRLPDNLQADLRTADSAVSEPAT